MERIFPAEANSGQEWIMVGRITRPQALKGWFRLQPEIDDLEVFSPGLRISIAPESGRPRELEIEQVQIRPRLVLLKAVGIDSCEAADSLRGQIVYLAASALPELPEDSFYYYELIGCKVVQTDGSPVGEVREIQPGPGGDIVIIQREKDEIMIPAAKAFIKSIDMKERTIMIDPPEELL